MLSTLKQGFVDEISFIFVNKLGQVLGMILRIWIPESHLNVAQILQPYGEIQILTLQLNCFPEEVILTLLITISFSVKWE